MYTLPFIDYTYLEALIIDAKQENLFLALVRCIEQEGYNYYSRKDTRIEVLGAPFSLE